MREVREEQPKKARLSMLVSVVGSVISVSEVQHVNACWPMVVMSVGSTHRERELQL